MSQEKIRVGQIGVGYWGPNLLRNLDDHPRCEVVSVAELDADRRAYLAEHYPRAKVVATADAVLEDPAIDAVVIATPAQTHFPLSTAALRAGKHVLVEKPMASSSAEVRQMAALAGEKNLTLMVGHTFIYNQAVRKLREIIENGELGQIRYIYSQRLNLGRIRSDVDALWNFAPHDVSIIQYLLGDPMPRSVHRHGMDYVQKGIQDVVFLNITYPNKVLANIHVSWLDPHRMRKMVIVGQDRMAIYDDIAEQKIVIYDKGIDRMAVLGQGMDYDSPIASFQYRSGTSVTPAFDFIEPLRTEIDHFVECILDGVPCLTGPDHAERVIRILETA